MSNLITRKNEPVGVDVIAQWIGKIIVSIFGYNNPWIAHIITY